MFASKVKKVVEVNDGDVIVAVTIRKLSDQSLEKAAEVRAGQRAAGVRALGGNVVAEVRKAEAEIRDLIKKEATDPAAAKAARYDAYDRGTVLRAGIDSWTSNVAKETGVDDLDRESAEFLFKEIIDLSVPEAAVAVAEGKGV